MGVVSDWGNARRADAALTVQTVLDKIMAEPYRGALLSDGEISPAGFSEPESAARHFERALVTAVSRMGVQVRRVDGENLVDADGAVLRLARDAVVLEEMLMETVAIAGSVQGGMAPAGEVACGIIEASTELMRALICGAVIGAMHEEAEEDDIVVFMHVGPDIRYKAGLDSKVSALLRVRGVVYDDGDPTRSYLLGESRERIEAGGDGLEPLQVVYRFPLVEHFYGPNRLRWKDQRSAPVYEAEPEVVAS